MNEINSEVYVCFPGSVLLNTNVLIISDTYIVDKETDGESIYNDGGDMYVYVCVCVCVCVCWGRDFPWYWHG